MTMTGIEQMHLAKKCEANGIDPAEIDHDINYRENKAHLTTFERKTLEQRAKELDEESVNSLMEKQLNGTEPLKERISELTEKSTHFIIIGARGEGKTALAFKLLESHKGKRKCFVYRHPTPNKLPAWISNLTKIELLPENSALFIDEASNDFDQYSYAKRTNVFLRNRLQIARHKRQSFIFATTTTSFINRNFLHLIDVYVLKQPSLFQLDEERRTVRNIYRQIEEAIALDEFYWYDSRTLLKGSFDKPDWFTEELSTSYNAYMPERI